MSPPSLAFEPEGPSVRAERVARPDRPALRLVADASAAPPTWATPSRSRRGLALGGLALVHVGLVVGLLNIPAVRERLVDAKPVMLQIVTPPAPPPPPHTLPPPSSMAPPRAPEIVVPPIDLPPTPSPVIATTVPAPAPVPPKPVVAAPAAPPAPVAPPAPKVIPADQLQCPTAPQPVYPAMSRRMKETGQVIAQFYLNEQGIVQQIGIAKSSGFDRLDQAALSAVRRYACKPWINNGVPSAGWVSVPFEFSQP